MVIYRGGGGGGGRGEGRGLLKKISDGDVLTDRTLKTPPIHIQAKTEKHTYSYNLT